MDIVKLYTKLNTLCYLHFKGQIHFAAPGECYLVEEGVKMALLIIKLADPWSKRKNCNTMTGHCQG